MSRLASFGGPSTPNSSPVQYKPQGTPASPSRQIESTYHRKVRTLFQELRLITEIWNDLVLLDGLKAARTLVDGRTSLDNSLSLIPDRRPRLHLVGPKLSEMESCLASLEIVLQKLHKQFKRMSTVVDSLEDVFIEACKTKGWKWVHEEPMWVTWSLEKFVNSVPDILVPYHRSLNFHVELVDALRPHSTPFDKSRFIISKWYEQPLLTDDGWEAKLEDLCAAEIEGWNKL